MSSKKRTAPPKRTSEEGSRPPTATADPNRVRSRRWWLATVPVGVVAGGLAVLQMGRARARRSRTSSAPASGISTPATRFEHRQWRKFLGARGPWGQLEYTWITIEPLDESLPAPETYGPPQWFFLGETAEEVQARLAAMGVPPAQLQTLVQAGKWLSDSDGTLVEPPIDVVLSLAAETRASLYGWLARSEPNVMQRFPTSVQPQFLEERLETRGMSPATVTLFKRLLYQRGDWTLFSDLQALLARTAEPAERMRLVALSLRNSTFMVRLRVEEGSDLASIERYWRYPERPNDLGPILRSLSRVPGGYALDLAHLLPPMPRKRLYTYPPVVDDPLADKRDCYWTSLNFVNEPTVDEYVHPEKAFAALRRQFVPTAEASQYGDILVLYSARQRLPIHAAPYLADDVVFTKNGRSLRQPWMLMKKADMISYYASTLPEDDQLEVRVFRRRGT